MSKYKLVFFEPGTEEPRIYFVDEFSDDGEFLSFTDPKNSDVVITYNKKFLVKTIENTK